MSVVLIIVICIAVILLAIVGGASPGLEVHDYKEDVERWNRFCRAFAELEGEK